jgi:hypothetical protein
MELSSIEAETNRTALFQRGLHDGIAARSRGSAPTPYLRVGIDPYAQGYRSGFYSRTGACEGNHQQIGNGG